MDTVGMYEFKTHAAQFVERASKGQRITITKRGVPVAMIIPPEKNRKKSPSKAVDEFLAYRDKRNLTLGMPIRKAIEEGRR